MTQSKAHAYAIKAASFTSHSGAVRNYKLCAIAIRGQRCYAGWNSYQTHPLQAYYGKNEYSIHLHAEVAAMIRAKWSAEALVVVRVMADGSLANAMPCAGCRRALVNVSEVWYSNSVGGLDKL